MKKLILAGLIFGQVSGASADVQRVFEAQPMEPEKIIQQVPHYVPVPMPGQVKAVESEAELHAGVKTTPAGEKDATAVVDEGVRQAIQVPGKNDFFNSITMYPYMDGALYTVYAAKFRMTDIRLQPGEKIVGNPVAGDTYRWQVARNVSGQGATRTEHIAIRPVAAGLKTNLTIYTDRRTYYLELRSFNESYMASVAWNYMEQPKSFVADVTVDGSSPVSHAKNTQQSLNDVATLDPGSLHFGYKIKNVEGKPSWRPERVFDNGTKTFIHFPDSVSNGELPALFIMTKDRQSQVVNFRTIGRFYVVDRLFETAELRIGEGDDVEIVHVIRG